MVKKIDQGQKRPSKSLKSEVKILKRGGIDAPRLEQWSEDIGSEITPFLELLGEGMKYLENNSYTRDGWVGIGISELAALEDNWEGEMNEVVSRIDGMAVFVGGGLFQSRMECVDFA